MNDHRTPAPTIRLPDPAFDNLLASLGRLPELPSVVRYYDDFLEVHHTIRDFDKWTTLVITADGKRSPIDCSALAPPVLALVRHVTREMLSRQDAKTVRTTVSQLGRAPELTRKAAVAAFSDPIAGFRRFWLEAYATGLADGESDAVRQMMFSICRLRMHPWGPESISYISGLPMRNSDQYKAVEAGDCFLPAGHQARIVAYLDGMARRLDDAPASLLNDEVRDASMLMLVYQQGVRPGQVARVGVDDVRVFETGAVHVRLKLTKKRDGLTRWMTRSVKREWSPLLAEARRRRAATTAVPQGVPRGSFFLLTPSGVKDRLQALCYRVTGERWTPTDLRHTAAQRQVNAGISHVGLSEFLGQDRLGTANVYFAASATQAQKVNQALGLSPIYSAVAEVARTKSIDKATLMGIDQDRQIGGVPHGIAISGIGACQIGQSACSLNPVLSCYGCHKFMAVRDPAVHRRVAADLRPVVRRFEAAGRGDTEAPAYTQLRRTMEEAERVAADLARESNGHE